MPQTMEEWKYLAGLYAEQIEEDKGTISTLKQVNNKLKQALAQARGNWV